MTTSQIDHRRARALRIVLALLFALAAVFHVRHAAEVLRVLFDVDGAARSPATLEVLANRVRSTQPEGAAAGLRDGDRILSIAGRPFEGRASLEGAVHRARAGEMLSLVVSRREGSEETLAIEVPLARRELTASIQVYMVLVGLVTPALCVGLGFWVAFLKPRDLRAWLLLFMLLSFAQVALAEDPAGWGPGLRVYLVAYDVFLSATWAVWMLLFGVHFPTRAKLDRRYPWGKWLLIVPLVLGTLARTIVAVASVEGWAWAAPVWAVLARIDRPLTLVQFTAIGAFFASMGTRAGMEKDPDDKRRLKLLYLGANAGLTPIFLLVLAGLFTGRNGFLSFPAWIVFPALICLVFFPLTLAYVIVVHRAFDVRVVLRQGMQYALARRGVVALQVLATIGAGLLALSLVSDPTANRPRKIRFIALAVMFGFGIHRPALRLRSWIDRRFFREAYDAERILIDLSEQVRTIIEVGPLLRTVLDRVSESLHVPRVAALIRGDAGFAPAHAMGFGPGGAPAFPESSAAIQRLAQSRQPLRVYLDDPASWANRESEGERIRLAALGAQLLLPLVVKDKLLGVLGLGPKRSEEPYSPSDVRLLQSVAGQAALALENGQLTAAIAREVAMRARMDREIEIAREVQEGLFPQYLPPVTGLEYIGFCRPALGVGGDYYDFVEIAGGGLGIAIGDVSGKGIPAALLMASLRASLRAQTISGSMDLAALMGRLNRLIYEASAANRYATFFYAQYEPATRRLSYVNAGHNAPMLFRASGVVARVEGGGPVIGLLPEAEYVASALVLAPGDLLLAYTDGISEAMNPQDEEWGEERMMDAVRAVPDTAPPTVLARVLAEADRFATGAKQHDDMTLVVARVV